MKNPSLYQSFEKSAAQHADQIALKTGNEKTKYSELEVMARSVASGLISLGIERGDRVAIWGVNSISWVYAGLGLQASGAALVPIGTRLRGREISGILEDSGARVIFTDRTFGNFDFVAALLKQNLCNVEKIVILDNDNAGYDDDRVISLGDLRALGEILEPHVLADRIAGGCGDDLADILFTSGTTGKPKGVPVTQAQSLRACRAQQEEIVHFTPDDVFPVSYPFAHNAGYRAGWQVSLLYGVCVIPIRVIEPGEMLKIIEAEKVTFLPIVPTVAQAILDHPDRAKTDLSSVRIVATGAAMIPVKLIEDLLKYFNKKTIIATGYGLTEAAGSVTHTPDDASAKVIATSVGKALDCLDVKIVGPDHVELPIGKQGEIVVKGPQILKGYYQNPEATKKAFTNDGFLLTGDVGWKDEEGYYHITDRIKDMYMVGGFNCYPAEIENMLLAMDGVSRVAVIGIDEKRLGQVGHAFIVRSADSLISKTDIVEWCRAEMANYKVPRAVTFLDELPVNATGKIDKIQLRKMT